MNVTVQLNNEKRRYEAAVDGQPAGHIAYTVDGDVLDMHHTEVDGKYEGQGVGGQLVQQALDQARSIGKKVKPSCPFIASWIEKHPDYQDLVA